jgi:hypothetical protein
VVFVKSWAIEVVAFLRFEALTPVSGMDMHDGRVIDIVFSKVGIRDLFRTGNCLAHRRDVSCERASDSTYADTTLNHLLLCPYYCRRAWDSLPCQQSDNRNPTSS